MKKNEILDVNDAYEVRKIALEERTNFTPANVYEDRLNELMGCIKHKARVGAKTAHVTIVEKDFHIITKMRTELEFLGYYTKVIYASPGACFKVIWE